MTALGTGFATSEVEFDLEKLRYHKIIIMTDADVDGAHIRTLLLTLLYRHMRPLFEAGYIYVAMPPLYKAKRGKEERYAWNDDQLKKVIEKSIPDGQRQSDLAALQGSWRNES